MPDYVAKSPETVLKASLKRYLPAKKKLVSFAGTVGVHEQFLANQIRLLEEGETVDRQELPEHYKSLLADLGNEVIAERNRKTELYMDKFRKARNPELYGHDSIDMRACKINLGKFVYNGGIHSTIAVLNSLLTREEHKPSRDFNLN